MYEDQEDNDSPSWLDALPFHPIFHTETCAQLNEKFQALKLYGNPQGKRSKITTSINENLIVAVDSELRILNLMEFKFAWRQAYDRGELTLNGVGEGETIPEWMEEVKYITLDTPSIKFQIQSVVVNFKERGSLIAVIGDYELAVIVLPKSIYPTPTTNSSLPHLQSLQCWPILSRYWCKSNSQSVMAPYERDRISSDGLDRRHDTQAFDLSFRMYNVLDSVSEPEQRYSFSPNPTKNHNVSFSVEDTRAVSFCFGQGYEGWGGFVVYVLTDGGDVYSMCPIVPKKCFCHKFFLDQLACLVTKKYSETEILVNRQGYENCEILLEQYRQQVNWVSAVYKQINGINSDRVIFNPPSIGRRYPKLQGPYLIQPQPVELSSHATDASDIIFLPTEPVSVIAIAYNNGRIDVCLEVDKVEALWEDSIEVDHPTLILYECIDLGFVKDFVAPTSWRGQKITNSINHPTLVSDPFYPDVFYVYHFAGAHGIVLKGWLDELGEAISEDSEKTTIEEFLGKNRKSDVNWIAGTFPSDPDPLVGISIINDVQLSYAILMISSTLQLIHHELTIRKPLMSVDRVRLNEDYYNEGSRPNLLSIIKFPDVLERYRNYQGLTHQPKLLSSRNKTRSTTMGDEIDYEFIFSLMGAIQQEVHDIKEAENALSKRFEIQSTEFRRQVKEVSDARKYMDEHLNNKHPEISDRLQRLRDTQIALESKANTIIQRLMYQDDPILGEFETSYYQSLENINQAIKGENGLRVKIKQLQTRHLTLKQDYRLVSPQRSLNKSKQFVVLSGSQLSKVEDALSKEMELIDDTTRKIEKAQEKLKKLQLKNSKKAALDLKVNRRPPDGDPKKRYISTDLRTAKPAYSPLLEAKVVILGSQGVGKTSLAVRYVQKTFSPNCSSTIGASFMTKKLVVDNCKVRLQIWDTAGQERFRTMAPMYYRGANAAILVYDITSDESFRDMNSWVEELRKNMTEDLIIHVVGNKLDLAPSHRVVPFTRTQEYVSRILGTDCAVHEVSAKDDNGVEELFLQITRSLVERKNMYEMQSRQISNNRKYIENEAAPSSGCCTS
ncbi:6096_t:CDS:10 [Acaulospora morrowiae]|uniref:6096_t:CDS:1 n=1 Tax=Acaulospora morrowiae TaxID=94023 RepID=A0A9N8W272_9GLOM|nr:6096_t:CDS:10 [Acaulospora morrowiae]